jgi:hypothetical protein
MSKDQEMADATAGAEVNGEAEGEEVVFEKQRLRMVSQGKSEEEIKSRVVQRLTKPHSSPAPPTRPHHSRSRKKTTLSATRYAI